MDCIASPFILEQHLWPVVGAKYRSAVLISCRNEKLVLTVNCGQVRFVQEGHSVRVLAVPHLLTIPNSSPSGATQTAAA